MALPNDPGTSSGLRSGSGPTHASRITELTEANRRLKRKLFDLYTLFEISRNLGRLLEIEHLLDNLLLTAIGQMGIGGALVLVDRRQDDTYLGIWRAKGVSPPRGFTPRLEKSGALLSRVRSVRMPLPPGELERDRKLSVAEHELLSAFEVALVCPMVVKEQVRGVLLVTRRLSGAAFSENDKEFLSILIGQFAVAMDNARLYESERTAHQRLREAQSQLVHSEKLAAMGRLSATIAHEVNNPLGIIKNYLHLLKSDGEEAPDRGEHLGVVSEEVDRIAEIVRRLLDFHRPATPGKHDLNLWRVIVECLNLLGKSQETRRVHIALPDERPAVRVHANTEEMKQVFLNLFMNALDAMPEGGTLSVRVIRRRRSVLVQVADTGSGIDAADLPKLFEPFFTTKAEGQGTGLGLYVCYGIIQRHGGRIVARNLADGGTVFTVRLPIGEVS